MFILLTVLILLASIALVLLVIVQKSKGGGLASPFASSNNIMGVRKTTDVLEKATWWCFGIVAALCIISSRFVASSNPKDNTLKTVEQEATKGAAPALPNFGGGAPATAPQATPAAPAAPASNDAAPATPAPAAAAATPAPAAPAAK